MTQSLRHQSDDVSQEWNRPGTRVSLGAVHLAFAAQKQTLIETHEFQAVVSGEIYNRDELKHFLQAHGVKLNSAVRPWDMFVAGVIQLGS
jgi:asparagine synthetase B (glutamine-hydrolysing)